MFDSITTWLSNDLNVQGWYLLLLVFLGALGGAAVMVVAGENSEQRHRREVMNRDLASERRRRRVAAAFGQANSRPAPLRPSRPVYTGRVPGALVAPPQPARHVQRHRYLPPQRFGSVLPSTGS